jgi:hypothetical protein
MNSEYLPADFDDLPGGLPVRSEEIGFKPEELSVCSRCGRANGPDRSKCLYCGAAMEARTGAAEPRLDLTRLEEWEKGWNVAAISSESPDAAEQAATILPVDGEIIKKVLGLGTPIPVTRIATEREALLIGERLGKLGLATAVISDEELSPGTPPVRLRGLERRGDVLVLEPFNGGPAIELQPDKLALIVEGTIVESRSETVETRKKRSNKTISEATSATDECVIDIYSDDDPTGWRIRYGFDFSCLGQERSMFAAENARRLARWLAAQAPNARFVEDYNSCRRLLDGIWEPEVRKESLGVQRTGFGRVEMNTAVVTSNLRQFTKFSRLQYLTL